jgi:hypothetical protein
MGQAPAAARPWRCRRFSKVLQTRELQSMQSSTERKRCLTQTSEPHVEGFATGWLRVCVFGPYIMQPSNVMYARQFGTRFGVSSVGFKPKINEAVAIYILTQTSIASQQRRRSKCKFRNGAISIILAPFYMNGGDGPEKTGGGPSQKQSERLVSAQSANWRP